MTELEKSIKAINVLRPSSRQEMIEEIKAILSDNIINVIDSHNTASIVFVILCDSVTYILKAECGAVDATNREISWYRAVKGNSPAPNLIYSHKSDDFSFLVLEYIPNAITLDEIIVSDNYTNEQLINYIDLALAENRALFNSNDPEEVSYEIANTFLIQKFDARIERSQKYPYLKKLLETPLVTINGKLLHTPTFFMNKIKRIPRLHNYLTPKRVGLTHGDLHFGNILVNQNGVYFIDPNSAAHMPIEYDYGRLLHSAHGAYGQIMNKKYSLMQIGEDNYDFRIEIPSRLNLAFEHIKSVLTEQELVQGLYTEALHFATMLPNHVADQEETLALFLRDVELFNELFNHERIKAII